MSTWMSNIERRLKYFQTIAPDYNIQHAFVRQHDLNAHISELTRLNKECQTKATLLEQQLSTLYASDVVNEWLSLYLMPLMKQIEMISSQFMSVADQHSWVRRPLVV
jgi:hypothetical protein